MPAQYLSRIECLKLQKIKTSLYVKDNLREKIYFYRTIYQNMH